MLHALSFALLDSVNLLLIGVLFALGIMHPTVRAYRKIAAVLVVGDWFGVLLLSFITMVIFGGIGDLVQSALESPWVGILLIAVGLLSIVATMRGGDSSAMVDKLAAPLRQASLRTFLVGMGLGLIQSATSIPFFVGLAFLSTAGFPLVVTYLGLFLYASLALSLPTISAVLVGLAVRAPKSPFGQMLVAMRARQDLATAYAGYAIGVVLIVLGVVML
ncbi:hypothetical protein F7230_02525 [Corynebacterium sp. 320]|uniref:hypothetical protein n=1 Tax=Corynebacterium TaxID=1716 RepID=UPI00125CD02E|nr:MULTISPECIES: hypothetical protein [Corynebacterium]KAB1503999.1 hypothetical protein F7230_02525 [Corynebacterium sp. 320]KAB1552902.1 hypothetical protein F7233_04070 [Corynebacterium sp. 321]KAB1553880.1 hypothetical protein F7232_02515 [Corynebacterium sp. 319]KAB3528135.1 hypothetical protein F8354_02525 [Corynebacterium sp. 250]KAB3540377.1 hypothetical protein F8390_03815 [Corynebacterium sp. 366]